MAFSFPFDRLDSALHDVGLLVEARSSDSDGGCTVKELRLKLRVLKSFLLSARKLSRNRRLASFLFKVEDTVSRIAEQIHPLCLDLNNSLASLFQFQKALELLAEIRHLEGEINEWFVSILDPTRASSSLTSHQVLENITSFSETLLDFHSLSSGYYHFPVVEKAMKELEEQLRLLKSLISFVDAPTEDLLAHADAVATDATYLFFRHHENIYDKEMWERLQFGISTLAQKIKPIDPQVCEIYTRNLSSSKLSSDLLHQQMDGVGCAFIIVTGNFLDSLISSLWDMLKLHSCDPTFSMNDKLRKLYRRLRSLRTFLKQQSNDLDSKCIRDVLCDAGVLICSLHQTQMQEVELGLEDLLKTIKIIFANLGEKDPQMPGFNFPRTNQLGVVDFIMEKLMELTNREHEPTFKSHLQTIQDELVFLRSFLGDIVELRHRHKELQTLWDCVLEVAYRVECLMDHLLVCEHPDSFEKTIGSIIKDIRNIKADMIKTSYGKISETKVNEVERTYTPVSSQRTVTLAKEVVGFADEAKSIVHRLTRGQRKLHIVAIVGMPGIGKTTLATKVYNEAIVLHHFSVRARCTISQVLDKKKVLIEILNQIDPNTTYYEMAEHDLAEKLRRRLKRRRYLILLDDIWDIHAWNSLAGSFPDDNVESRVLLTTRHHDVPPRYMLDQEPLILTQLSKEESLELLERKLFVGTGWPSELSDLGIQIAEICKGLPLALVVLAGLLAKTEREEWKKLLDGVSSSIAYVTEQCMKTLELSFRHLPDDLKPCLLYFGAFPEDHEISVRRMLRLWVAEGFVRTTNKSMDDVAEDYLKDLVDRSLVMVSKQRWDGGVKTCRIHDLLRDFCVQKANDEHFFHFLKGYDELLAFDEPANLRRLCISSEPKHFKESKLFCPRTRSLLFNSFHEILWSELADVSFVIDIFKLLRVLDLEQIYLSNGYPSEMEMLVQLAFLAIAGQIRQIPSSIAKLSNLETLIVDPSGGIVSLPVDLWSLQKLKYLYLRSKSNFDGCTLPTQCLYSSSVLYELDRFSGAIIPHWDSMEMLMRKFPNIRKLKCILFEHKDDMADVENLDRVVFPDFLCQLQSLHVSQEARVPLFWEFELILPATLKKLTLSTFYLPWGNVSAIAKLPNLEVLKLLDVISETETWEMNDGDFSKLRILKLSSWDLVSWRASDDQFVCLQKLVLKFCRHLKELPSCLESLPTLEMIEVSYCSDNVVNLVGQIEDEQVNWGNSDLKVIIQSSN